MPEEADFKKVFDELLSKAKNKMPEKGSLHEAYVDGVNKTCDKIEDLLILLEKDEGLITATPEMYAMIIAQQAKKGGFPLDTEKIVPSMNKWREDRQFWIKERKTWNGVEKSRLARKRWCS